MGEQRWSDGRMMRECWMHEINLAADWWMVHILSDAGW